MRRPLSGSQFTPQSSRAANAAKREYAREREQILALRESRLEELANALALRSASDVDFVGQCRDRARAIMRKWIAKLEAEPAAEECGAWTLALSRLGELERAWDGRPLPGALKPTGKPGPRRSAQPAATAGPLRPAAGGAQVTTATAIVPVTATAIETAGGVQVEASDPASGVENPGAGAPWPNPPGMA